MSSMPIDPTGFVIRSPCDEKKCPIEWSGDRRTQSTLAVPIVDTSMRYMWNAALDSDITPDTADMWVHNYSKVVLIEVEGDHAESLPTHWSDYNLDTLLGDVDQCDWGYLESFADKRP